MLPGKMPVFDPVRLICIGSQPGLFIGLIFRIVSVKPVYAAVPLE
jgi:hypothetical protein